MFVLLMAATMAGNVKCVQKLFGLRLIHHLICKCGSLLLFANDKSQQMLNSWMYSRVLQPDLIYFKNLAGQLKSMNLGGKNLLSILDDIKQKQPMCCSSYEPQLACLLLYIDC